MGKEHDIRFTFSSDVIDNLDVSIILPLTYTNDVREMK